MNPPIFLMLQKSIPAMKLKVWKDLRRNLTGMMRETVESLQTS